MGNTYVMREEIAQIVGPVPAMVYERIRFMVEQNALENRNEIDGKFWVVNSIPEWKSYFSFLTEKQIRTSLEKLREAELLVTIQPRMAFGDRTFWYTVAPKAQDMVGHLPKRAEGASAQKGTSGSAQKGTSGSAQKGTSYKDKTQETLETHTPCQKSKPSKFQDFWDQYPHRNGAKKGRAKAESSYARRVKGGATENEIIQGAMRYATDRQVLAGYAKDPTTWLNGECWRDDIEPAHIPKQVGTAQGSRTHTDDDLRVIAARMRRSPQPHFS